MFKKASEDSKGVTLTLEYERPKTIWKIVAIVAGSIFLALLISLILLFRRSQRYLNTFLEAAQVDQSSLESIVADASRDWQHYYQNPETAIRQKNILILGGDQLSSRDGDPVLTDTILLLQLDVKNSQIKTLALPRDLYSPDYQTKINALYHYGLQRDSANPLQFPTQVISEMTGLSIDHTLLINIEDLEYLIELAGGVKVEIPVGFSDPLFPRQDVDVSKETDPAILYETVSFEAGSELMSGRRALQYMRSRHSGDDQGTDLARANRQQLVLQALIEKLADPTFLVKEPELLGQLYRFYLDHFAEQLSVNELIRILLSWLNWNQAENRQTTSFNFLSLALSVYPENEDGLLINPPLWQTQQQWRYDVRNQEIFKNKVAEFFKAND